MRHAPRILWLVALGLCLLSVPSAADEPRPKDSLAQVSIAPTRVEWLPLADYKHLVLTVAGPGDFYLQREFRDGEALSFSPLDFQDDRLPDGVYAYELRAEGEPVQSGHLWVQEGRFVDKLPADLKPPIRNITAQETVTDDLVVQGQACIGGDCLSGDGNGPALKIKEFGNRQIMFDAGCCYPTEHDWALEAGDFSGLNGDFLIRDLFAGTVPFRVGTYAPDNALTISPNNGNIGLGTLTPGAKLHLYGTATSDVFAGFGPNPASGPALNIGYGGTSFGRGAGFLNVRPDASATAPNPSLRFLTANVERMIITNTGGVGIGTSSPSYKLHLFDNTDVATVFMAENTSTGVNAVGSFRAQSNTAVAHFRAHGSGRTITHFGVVLGGWSEMVQDIGNGLAIGTLNDKPIILGTNNANRLEINGSTGAVTISGNLTVNGTFSNPSSRELKEGFQPVDPRTVLDKFARLPIQEWSYKSDTRKLRHVGPTVEDFQTAFGLGTEGQYIFPMDVQGVTMTAVQGLYQLVQEKDAKIAELAQEKDAQHAQIAELQKELREIKQLLLEKVAEK
jgi:hypothetical protein